MDRLQSLAERAVSRKQPILSAIFICLLMVFCLEDRRLFPLIERLEEGRFKHWLASHYQRRLHTRARTSVPAAVLVATHLLERKSVAEACGFLEESLTRQGDHPELLLMLGECLFSLDRFSDLDRLLTQRLLSRSDLMDATKAAALQLAAKTRLAFGDAPGARAYLERLGAENILPKTLVGRGRYEGLLSCVDLALGNFDRAHDYYWSAPLVGLLAKQGCKMIDRGRLEAALASGHPLPGQAVILCAGMGVGDEVRLSQMIPQMARLFERLTLICDDRLVPIFTRSFPGVTFVGRNKADDCSEVDVRLRKFIGPTELALLQSADHVGDLKQFCAVLRNSAQSYPTAGHHLTADPARVAKWRELFAASEGQILGLFWRSTLSGAVHKQTSLKSWLEYVPPLSVRIVPLQYDLQDTEIALFEGEGRLMRVDGLVDIKNDLEEMFGLLAALPVVISLPGTTQHMAGAVGTAVWCPTHPYQAPWRRLHGRNHEAWAPSVEIISAGADAGLKGAMDMIGQRLIKEFAGVKRAL
jgi:tetratricopeptide (TPR) repeat protein